MTKKPVASGLIFNGIARTIVAGILIAGFGGNFIHWLTDSPNHGKYRPWYKKSSEQLRQENGEITPGG